MITAEKPPAMIPIDAFEEGDPVTVKDSGWFGHIRGIELQFNPSRLIYRVRLYPKAGGQGDVWLTADEIEHGHNEEVL